MYSGPRNETEVTVSESCNGCFWVGGMFGKYNSRANVTDRLEFCSDIRDMVQRNNTCKTDLLGRMVLDHELNASRLSGDHKAAQDLALHPDLAVLTNDDAFGVDSAEIVESFYDVHRPFIRDKLLLPLPSDTNACANFVPHAGQT